MIDELECLDEEQLAAARRLRWLFAALALSGALAALAACLA